MLVSHRRIKRLPAAVKRISRKSLRKKQAFDRWLAQVQNNGLYPLTAVGMPVPGPDFIRHAEELGDTETVLEQVEVPDESKKSGKKKVWQAKKIGDRLKELYRCALRQPGFTLPIAMRGGAKATASFIPGHIWGQYFKDHVDLKADPRPVDGPHPADVMVIGKMPWKDEFQMMRNLVGASGEVLTKMIEELHIQGARKWYVTNLCKFMPPDGGTTIKADWLKDCRMLLQQELRIVKPKYILCLGADASKELLGSKFGVNYMEGRVIEYTYPTGVSAEDPRPHTALVMTVIHPAQVARDQSAERQLYRGMARFNLLQQGIRFDKEELDIDHRAVDTLADLEQLLYEVENDPEKTDSVIGVDAEWHGEHPVNAGSYVRTIQFAWRPKHAAAIKLHSPGGKKAFRDEEGRPAVKKAIALLGKFFNGGTWKHLKFRKKRVVMHFGVADQEWFLSMGLDMRSAYAVPLYDLDLKDKSVPLRLRKHYRRLGFTDVVPAWVRTRYEGGADTGMMAHAVEESAAFKLETLALRYTTVPRYDVPLHDWREAYCKEHGLTAKNLEGYGECPDEILIPYGIYDADATLRLYYEYQGAPWMPRPGLLEVDYEGNCCREAFWESMIIQPAILEIHRNGIAVDRKRIDYLTTKFMEAREKQEARIKRWARWPEFNIRSVQHVKEFLFGEQLNGKVTKDGKIVRIRPKRGEECGFCDGAGVIHVGRRKPVGCSACNNTGWSLGAHALNLAPLVDTSKPPKPWGELVMRGEDKFHNPSTNKQVLAILAQENDAVSTQVNWIRDYRFLDQVLKSVLRPPRTDDAGNWLHEEAGDEGVGDLLYDAGLAYVICDDGRVRTHLYPTAETGRWRSARPNLQNMSKQRDPDYTRLLGGEKNEKGKWVGGDYIYPLRSVLMASPGHVLVEADYVGAELFGMAVMSGDPTMIDHAFRNQLPEDSPDYYDIHSNVAVLAFRLRCQPTKKGLDDIGKVHLRIIAKNVIFGIAYGRGAAAIAFSAKEQGIQISVNEAQQVIDTIFDLYPGLVPFFEEAEQRAIEERWLCHCFGRFRRFPHTDDQALKAEFGRQAKNFPIQGMVASCVDRAIAYLYDYRQRCPNPNLFKILLQIHDALLLEVPYEHVEFVAQEVLPWAMRTMIPIYPSRLDGRPTHKGPYRLGIDVEVMKHWGEKLKEEQARKYGFSRKIWTGNGVTVKYAA